MLQSKMLRMLFWDTVHMHYAASLDSHAITWRWRWWY